MKRTKRPESWLILICPWCGNRGMYHPDGPEVNCQAPQCGRPFKVSEAKREERSEPQPEDNGRIESIEERLLRTENEVKEHDRDLIALKLLKTWLAGWLMLIGGAIIAVLIERFLK